MIVTRKSGACHAAALAYAAKGWNVFPCQPRSKTPATSRGVLDATTDVERINNWWRFADLNIGIATGLASGFFALDIDGEDGEASLRKLESEHGELPSTVEVITGKGRHCYFRIGEHGAVKNSVGQIAPGLDIRGDGGYVLAPPSVHPSGRDYSWSVDSADEFADAPEWLHALIHGGNTSNGAKGKPLEHWHRVLTNTVKNGERNSTLASVCGKLLHAGLSDLTLLYDVMLCINASRCEQPIPETEVETIVASVVRSHLKKLHTNA
jgi:Bifunctional DNA primase/polymerase, N-terminal/Primase C terminal 1 (PriCT-1)